MNHQSRFDAWYRMLGVVHWDDPEGWDGEGDGSGVQDVHPCTAMYTCTPMADSSQCMAKPIQCYKVK